VINTYLWIMETAYSRINNIIKIGMVIIYILGIFSEICLKRVNNKCPAIILADSRIAKVKGRIIFLVVSINTIKEVKGRGVPKGTI